MAYTLRIRIADLKHLPRLGELQGVISSQVDHTEKVDLTTPSAEVRTHWCGALERAGCVYELREGQAPS